MRDTSLLKVEIEKVLVQPVNKISVVDLIDLFVEYAYSLRASDVHIEPAEQAVRIRFRIDGLLQNIFRNIALDAILHSEIISRIKVLAGMRTDEHNTPQDGRFKVRIEGLGDINVRVSVMPTHYGENAILRILAEAQKFSLEDLGLSQKDLQKVERAIQKPYGMILANGPTGSGKTTTLYTILKRLNREEVSIITVEDPVEYSLEGATQVQIYEQVGFTFSSGLRSILRQDPNIIMVGEIRDQETATIAVNAALTGHLMISTLHTNDSATTFPRLIDMGVPPFLIASTVNIVMGQRLVRTICQECKTERVLTPKELKSAGELVPDIVKDKIKTFYTGKGCAACNKTGYQGRIGIREVLEINEEIRQLIMNRAGVTQIKEAAVRNGMTTMIRDGLDKAQQGLTSLEEVLRIIHE